LLIANPKAHLEDFSPKVSPAKPSEKINKLKAVVLPAAQQLLAFHFARLHICYESKLKLPREFDRTTSKHKE